MIYLPRVPAIIVRLCNSFILVSYLSINTIIFQDLDGNFEDGLKSEANVIRKPFNLDKISHKCEKLTSDGGVLKLLTKRGIGEVVPKGSSVLCQ